MTLLNGNRLEFSNAGFHLHVDRRRPTTKFNGIQLMFEFQPQIKMAAKKLEVYFYR